MSAQTLSLDDHHWTIHQSPVVCVCVCVCVCVMCTSFIQDTLLTLTTTTSYQPLTKLLSQQKKVLTEGGAFYVELHAGTNLYDNAIAKSGVAVHLLNLGMNLFQVQRLDLLVNCLKEKKTSQYLEKYLHTPTPHILKKWVMKP